MKNISLVASHISGDTKDVNRLPETKVLVDRPRFSSKTKYAGAISYVIV